MPDHHPRFASLTEQERILALPTPYQIFRYMTRSEHLHFGLFRDRDEDFGAAQERMMQRLLELFPRDAKTVVDVGCGIGGTSCAMAERGLQVQAFAPEPGLIEYAKAVAAERGLADRTEFHACRLQEVPRQGIGPFDVVITQESLQYLHPLGDTLQRFWSLLREGGRLVIGDQVLRSSEHREHVQFHIADEIRAQAEQVGFALAHHEDVTAMARHTGPVSLGILREQRDDLIALFEPLQPKIAEDLDVCLTNGAIEASWYDQGKMGYELFAFDKPAG